MTGMYIIMLIFSLGIPLKTCRGASYDIILEYVEYDKKNDYITWNLEVKQYNATINTMDGTITVLKDIPIEFDVHIIGYEKERTDYYPTIVDATMNVCEFLKQSHVKKTFLTKSNFPKDCIIKAGEYKVNRMIAPTEDLPEKISGRYWKMELYLLAETEVVTQLTVYARIERFSKVKTPKKI